MRAQPIGVHRERDQARQPLARRRGPAQLGLDVVLAAVKSSEKATIARRSVDICRSCGNSRCGHAGSSRKRSSTPAP